MRALEIPSEICAVTAMNEDVVLLILFEYLVSFVNLIYVNNYCEFDN